MIDVKYAASNNSYHAKEPFQGTPDSAGYDLFAAESKVILAKSVHTVSTELKLEIPKVCYGKIHTRSSLIKNYFVTVHGGVLDTDFCSTVKIIMINHSSGDFKVNSGERVAKVIFQKKEEMNLIKVCKKELTET